MKPLRLLLLSHPKSIHTARFAGFFKSRGHKVDIFDISGEKGYEINGVEIHRPNRVIRWKDGTEYCHSFINNLLRLHRTIDRIKPDILHGHFITHWGWLTAFAGFKPYVLTCWGTDIFLDSQASASNFLMSRYSLQDADMITADSEDLLQAAVSLRGKKDNSFMIPFGIDLEIFRPGYDTMQLRRELNLENKKVVLSPREFKEGANIDVILNAVPLVVSKCPEAVFIIVAYSPSRPYAEIIKSLTKSLNIEEHVVFLSTVDHEKMPLLYNLSEAMITIRDTDGTPCSLLEAMACKTPVVAGKIKSIREWIKHDHSGKLVNQHKADEVAGAITELLTQETKARTLAENAYQVYSARS